MFVRLGEGRIVDRGYFTTFYLFYFRSKMMNNANFKLINYQDRFIT